MDSTKTYLYIYKILYNHVLTIQVLQMKFPLQRASGHCHHLGTHRVLPWVWSSHWIRPHHHQPGARINFSVSSRAFSGFEHLCYIWLNVGCRNFPHQNKSWSSQYTCGHGCKTKSMMGNLDLDWVPESFWALPAQWTLFFRTQYGSSSRTPYPSTPQSTWTPLSCICHSSAPTARVGMDNPRIMHIWKLIYK